MASSINKVTILGNVGKDPEIRNSQSGARIANISVATSESWKDKQSGEWRDRTEWHKVVVFNPHLINAIEANVKKGTKIYLEGGLQTRKWTDQSGNDKYSTEIVLQQFGGTMVILDKNGDQVATRDEPARKPVPAGGGDLDDSIPFAACWQ